MSSCCYAGNREGRKLRTKDTWKKRGEMKSKTKKKRETSKKRCRRND
jgi:hypothetical protein